MFENRDQEREDRDHSEHVGPTERPEHVLRTPSAESSFPLDASLPQLADLVKDSPPFEPKAKSLKNHTVIHELVDEATDPENTLDKRVGAIRQLSKELVERPGGILTRFDLAKNGFAELVNYVDRESEGKDERDLRKEVKHLVLGVFNRWEFQFGMKPENAAKKIVQDGGISPGVRSYAFGYLRGSDLRQDKVIDSAADILSSGLASQCQEVLDTYLMAALGDTGMLQKLSRGPLRAALKRSSYFQDAMSALPDKKKDPRLTAVVGELQSFIKGESG